MRIKTGSTALGSFSRHAIAPNEPSSNGKASTYLSQVKKLRRQLDEYDEPQAGQVSAKRAAAWLSALGETLASADVVEAKADLIHAVYEKTVVVGPRFVSARLTPAAYAYGLAALLPEVAMAPPAGFEPATGRLEGGCSVH
jgi:hypothetical protein